MKFVDRIEETKRLKQFTLFAENNKSCLSLLSGFVGLAEKYFTSTNSW